MGSGPSPSPSPPPPLTITSPGNGAIITADRVIMRGTVAAATGAPFTPSIGVAVPQAIPAPPTRQAVPTGGISPLGVALAVTNRTGRNLVQFEFDATGSGTFGGPTPTFNGVTATYSASV